MELILNVKNLISRNIMPFARYFVVGGAAFIADSGVIYVLTEIFSIYYLTSAAIGFVIGVVVNYLLSILWVFDNRKLENNYWAFTIFAFIGICGLLINHGVM